MFKKIFKIIFMLANFCVLAMNVNDRGTKRKEIEREVNNQNENKLEPTKKKPRIVPNGVQIDFEAPEAVKLIDLVALEEKLIEVVDLVSPEEESIKTNNQIQKSNFFQNSLVRLAAKKVAEEAVQKYDNKGDKGYDEFKNYLENLLDDVKIIVFDSIINDLDRPDVFINRVIECDNKHIGEFFRKEFSISLALNDLLSEIDSPILEKEKSSAYHVLQDLFTSDDRKFCLKQLLNILKQKIAQYDASQAVNAVDAELRDSDVIMEEVASSENNNIISGSVVYPMQTKIFDIETGQIQVLTNRIGSLSISNDNSFIVTGLSNSTTSIWDVKTGQCINVIPGPIRLAPISANSFNALIREAVNMQWDLEIRQRIQALANRVSSINNNK